MPPGRLRDLGHEGDGEGDERNSRTRMVGKRRCETLDKKMDREWIEGVLEGASDVDASVGEGPRWRKGV